MTTPLSDSQLSDPSHGILDAAPYQINGRASSFNPPFKVNTTKTTSRQTTTCLKCDMDSMRDLESGESLLAERRSGLRICIVTENFLPKIDGVTRTLARLLDHLRETGHEALIVGPDNGLVPPAASSTNIQTSYAGFSVHGTLGLPLFFYPELKWNFLSPVTLQRIITFKPDVLHFVDPILLGPQVIFAAKFFLPNVPRVSSYHTNIALYARHFGYPVLSPAIWGLQRYLHDQCSAIMCPSQSTSKTLVDHAFPADRIRIWHRGVDTELFSPLKRQKEIRTAWTAGEEKVLLLYVGRVSWEKNLKALSNAYIDIHAQRKDVHLVITGDGPARTELEAMFANAKAAVTFTGYLEGEELATAYASSDIFTFPSKSETFGQVVLEAQASGLPVIAFQAEGVCDIVQDGRTGWLVRTGTPEEEIQTFQMGIMAALNDAGKRKYASVEALRWASTWRWSEATKKAVDTYREAILD